MRYYWVISTNVFLVLLFILHLRGTPLAYAEQAQGTDEGESEAVPQAQQQLDISVVSMTRPPESTTSDRRRATDGTLVRVTTKLALDLGLIHQPEENALSTLERVGISPRGGWSRNTELTPEIFYEVLAAARRAASAGHLSVSADGAEAIVRAVMTPFLAPLEEGATEPLPFVAAEERPVVASEEPVFYEQAPLWPDEWQSGFNTSPVVVIVPRPGFSSLQRRHHVFVPCPTWRCRPGIAPFRGPVVRSTVFTRARISLPLRVVPMAPRSFSPPVFGFRGGIGAMHMSGGHFHGGFRRQGTARETPPG